MIVYLHVSMYDSMDDAFSTDNDSTDDEEDLNMTEQDEYMTEEDHRDKIWM